MNLLQKLSVITLLALSFMPMHAVRYDLKAIIETLSSIDQKQRTPQQNALFDLLVGGFVLEEGSLKLNYIATIAKNCHAIEATLMNYLIDQLETESNGALTQFRNLSQHGLFWSGTESLKKFLNLFDETLASNEKRECASCESFKEFIENQKALLERDAEDKTKKLEELLKGALKK